MEIWCHEFPRGYSTSSPGSIGRQQIQDDEKDANALRNGRVSLRSLESPGRKP